jgi:cytochrome c
MKKTIAIFGLCSLIFACTSGQKSEDTQDTSAVAAPAETTQGAAVTGGSTKGEQLISSSDCLTCHKVDAKIVGPSYVDVANKYPATDENIEMLASKIIAGGSGSWGEIPMAPHPAISKDDAKEMVKYILALKTK